MSRIVLCHGVFDLLHPGHVLHLQRARKLGTSLVVSIVHDDYCTKRKPIYSAQDRKLMLEALRDVTRVVISHAPGPERVIEMIRPQLYVRGEAYEGKRMPESDLLERLGIPTITVLSHPLHTSDLIARVKALP